MQVVFASNNSGKIRELQMLLTDFQITVIPQATLHVSAIPETGLSFVENAILKARHACQQTGMPALADDSGLEVDALHGAPGIYSARYAGENATAQNNIEKLLLALKDVPATKRNASFHCVLVYMTHANDPVPLICHGQWQGSILTAQRGQEGFGYDPIFYVRSENKSAAELPLTIKNKISHRGIALRLLLKELRVKLTLLNK
jgi:XTP/dITP diphosphohydrolase